MRFGVGQVPLARRIVASVALGLGIILILFGVVAIWTVRDSTQTAYRERVHLAEVFAIRADDSIRRNRDAFVSAVDELRLGRGEPLTGSQRETLTQLVPRLDAYAIGIVLDSGRGSEWLGATNATSELGPPAEQALVREAVSSGQRQVGEIHSLSAPRKAFAAVAQPARDSSGEIVGAILAVFDPDNANLSILPVGNPEDGLRAQLLTGDSGSDPGYLAEHRALLADLIHARTSGYRLHEQSPGAPYPSHVVAYAPISSLPGWGITVEQPQDIVLALPRELGLRLGVFGLIALALAAAVAWADTRRVVQPLKSLTASAERFAAGQFDQPVSLDRTDELGVLAHAFEGMRLQIRTSLAEVAEWNRSALLEPDRVIALVIQKARDLFDSEVAGLALAESGDHAPSWSVLTRSELGIRHAPFPVGVDLTRKVLETGTPQIVRDPECLPSDGTSAAPPLPEMCLRSALAVPLQSQGQSFGVLLVGSKTVAAFGESQIALLSRLADQAAVALENARLYREVQGQAALEERARIAREMHDGLGQVLGYVNTKTLAVARLLDVGKLDEARLQVGQLEAAAKEVYADVREAILGLRTTVGPEHDFLTALRAYLSGFELQTGIDVSFEMTPAEGSLGLSSAAELQVLRIAQEAMTNVRKHADAKNAVVRLASADAALQLVVEDDGSGFDPTRQTPDGWPRFGLQTMRERAKAIGGTLSVSSEAGRGTRIVVTVPRTRPEEVFGEAVANSAGR